MTSRVDRSKGFVPWSVPWLPRRAEISPTTTALVWNEGCFSYAALWKRVERALVAISGAGVAPGDVVAVRLPNGLPVVEWVHASFSGGFVLHLINTRLSTPEIEFQLRDSGASFFIHPGSDAQASAVELENGARRLRIDGPSFTAANIETETGLDPIPDVSPRITRSTFALSAPRFILYTSGTTGKPKGVVLSGANLLASANAGRALLGGGAGDRWLLCMPIFHVGGLSILLRSVLWGGAVILHESFSSEAVNRDLDEQSVTGISLVPAMLKRVLDARSRTRAPASLRCVLLGGAPVPAPLIEVARQAGFPVAPTYGLTEAASQVATRSPNDARGHGLVPLPGTEVEIRDELDGSVPPDQPGEICVRGPTITAGYWNKPIESARVLRGGWLHTGDIGSLDLNGRLEVYDRRSDLIVSGGENVYPAEVEAALLEHDHIAEVGVAGQADERFGERPVAYLVRAYPDVPVVDSSILDAHCLERLASFKCPIKFHWVEALPRTASGKLIRRRLGSHRSDAAE